MKERFFNEDGSYNFRELEKLTESERYEEMSKWSDEQWIAYKCQTPALSEDEVFEPIIALINEIYDDD